jgi:Xaa-Pro aminopeptidase
LADWQRACELRRAKLFNQAQRLFAKLHPKGQFGLAIPAGVLKVRANDCFYPFRPYSAFAHLTGLGQDYEPQAVLLIESETSAQLFTPSPKDYSTPEYFKNADAGSFWTGDRPTPEDFERFTRLPSRDLSELAPVLEKLPIDVVGIAGIDPQLDLLLGETNRDPALSSALAEILTQCASELRLIKDEFELQQLQTAVNFSKLGFENVIRHIPEILESPRSERLVEAKFHEIARVYGNAEGYDTIVGGGADATTLHWMRNNHAVRPDDLLLLDAGVELDSLYTADITRTIPLNGKFSDLQAHVYDIVLEAADAAFAIAEPGQRFSELNAAAFAVIEKRIAELGVKLPGDQPSAFRRWIVHGISHHLGLDVHDCAKARAEMYYDAQLQPGMCFTIEPGLYFKTADQLVPDELKGIGVRIEDNVHVTENGLESFSCDIPRTAADVEAWIRNLN